MARAACLLLAAARIGGDARMPPCPAGVKDDLNWYTTTSGGKVHDCAWLRLDPDTRCNNDGRFLNCPAACGKCLGVCQNDERDDDTWLRKHEAADGPHGCAWAAEEPRNRCFEMGADGRRSGEAFGSVARDARAVRHTVQEYVLQDSGAIWRRGQRHDHLGQRRPGRRGLRDVGVVEYGVSKTHIRYADPSLKPVMERHI